MTENSHNNVQLQMQLFINTLFSESLGLDTISIDNDVSLLEIGADSFTIMSVTRKIKNIFTVSIPIRMVFENLSTIDSISEYILQQSPNLSALKDIKIETSKKEAKNGEQKKESVTKIQQDSDNFQVPEMKTKPLNTEILNEEVFTPKRIGAENKIENIADNAASAWVDDSSKSQFTHQQQLYMEDFIENYCKKTASSKKTALESRPYLCNNRKSSSGFRFETKEMLYPIVANRSKGANIWDLDNNCYVDIAMGFGSTIFGHNPDFIKNRLIEQLQKGVQIGPESDLAAENAKLIASMINMDRVLFSNTGTEAVMTAIRIARAATNAKKVVLFQNSYHGHSDNVLAIPDITSDEVKSKGMVPGIPESAVEDTIILPYANINALSYIEEHANEIAAVVVEPVQNYLGNSNPKEFLQAARKITAKHGIVLVFDEVLVGFRISQGGAQKYFDVEADIATYGKAVAGGIPVGVIAGKSWCMDLVDGGFWNYGDNSSPKSNQTYTAGTFCKHPLAMAAVNAALNEMLEKGPEMQIQLNNKTEELCSILDEIIEHYKVPLKVHRFGSNFRFSMLGNLSFAFQPVELDVFFYHMINEGIYVWEGRTCFISTAHTDNDLNSIIQAVHNSILRMKKGGFWLTPDDNLQNINSEAHKENIKTDQLSENNQDLSTDWCSNISEFKKSNWSINISGDYERVHDIIKNYNSNESFTIGLNLYDNSLSKGFLQIPGLLTQYPGLSVRGSVNLSGAIDVNYIVEQWWSLYQLYKSRIGVSFSRMSKTENIAQFVKLWSDKIKSNEIFEKSIIPLWLEVDDDIEKFQLAGRFGMGLIFTPELKDTERTKKRIEEYITSRKSSGFISENTSVIASVYTCSDTGEENFIDNQKSILLNNEFVSDFILNSANISSLSNKQLLDENEKKFVLGSLTDHFIQNSTLIANSHDLRENIYLIQSFGIDELNFLLNYGESELHLNTTLKNILNILTKEKKKIDKIQYESLCPIVSSDEVKSEIVLSEELKESSHEELKLPMTDDQKMLYMLSKMSDGAMMTNSQTWALRVKGKLDIDRLRNAYQKVTDRHLGLRITYDDTSELQTFHSTFKVDIDVVDYSGLDYQKANENVTAFLKQEATKQYDLSKSFHRLTCIKINENENVIVLSCNHITIDGVSVSVVYTELTAFYNDLSLELEPPLSFDKFILWREQQSAENDFQHQEEYWLDEVSKELTVLDLPLDYPRPLVNSYNGSSYRINLGSEFFSDLKAFSVDQKCTYFMVVYAAFQVLLHRISGQKNIVIGVAFNGRTIPDSDLMIGFCANMYPIINTIEPDETVIEFLARTKDKLLGAFENQDYPFSSLVKKGLKHRDASRFPFFSVAFNWDRLLLPKLDDADVSWETFKQEFVKFDLVPNLMEVNNELTMMLEYNTDLFKEDTIRRYCEYYELIIRELVYQPNKKVAELGPIIGEDKNNQLLNWQGNNCKSIDYDAFHHLFEEQARKNPHNIALITDNESLTFGEVNKRSNQLANHLLSLLPDKAESIGICIHRSIEQVIAVLAVMKTGIPYLPLDPDYPESRLKYLIENSETKLILITDKQNGLLSGFSTQLVQIDNQTSKEIIGQQSPDNLTCEIAPDSPIYTIYTSGSTGMPKGVRVPHKGIINLAHNLNTHFNGEGIAKSGRWGWNSSLSFDGSLNALTQLFLGRPLFLLQDLKSKTPTEVWQYLELNKIELWDVSPSQLRILLPDLFYDKVKAVPSIVIGGEATDQPLWDEIRNYCNQYNVTALNVYGPTECSVVSHIAVIPKYMRPTIGKTLDNVIAYVVDENLHVLPTGSKGELILGGEGIALGYWKNEKLTNSKFISVPELGKHKLYKTGDIVRWLDDGTLEYIGRKDNQVQIRGSRVELGEVEATIQSLKEVTKAIVTTKTDSNEITSLVAYVVLSQNFKNIIKESELLERIKLNLPIHMIPSVLLIIDEIPLTVNGKIDEAALPQTISARENDYTAPFTDIQKVMTMIWGDLLDIKKISIHDDFFVIGGHSLLAIKAITRIRSLLGVELTLTDFFKLPTISLLSQKITDESKLEPNDDIPVVSSINKPLSFAQKQIWFLSTIDRENVAYNINELYTIKGQIDPEILDASLLEIIARHQILRSRIIESDEGPVSVVFSLPESILQVVEQGDCSEEGFIRKNCEEVFNTPYNLSEDLMLRARLITLKSGKVMFLISLHHIAADGWSVSLLKKEITAFYSAFKNKSVNPLEHLTVQYGDYSVWQNQKFLNGVNPELADFWKEDLSDIPNLHSLPTDYHRPAIKSYKGSAIGKRLPYSQFQKLKQLSKEKGVTDFIVLETIFATLLSIWSNEDDIIIGIPVNNRTHNQLESLIGCFVNTVVLRNKIDLNQSFETLLYNTKNVIMRAYDNQAMPFELLVEAVNPERSLSYSPVFQIMFAMENNEQNSLQFGDIPTERNRQKYSTSKFDLTLYITEDEEGYYLEWEYDTALFSSETIDKLGNYYIILLEKLLQFPNKQITTIDILSIEDKMNQTSNWQSKMYPQEAKNFHSLLEYQAKNNPDESALIFEGKFLSYKLLNEKVNQLARLITKSGLKKGSVIGICLSPSEDQVVSMLAAIKSGLIYVPLDPSLPNSRLEYIINDAGIKLIVADENSESSINTFDVDVLLLDNEAFQKELAQQSKRNLLKDIKTEDSLYIIYTSGSTGTPKGVLIRHQGIVNHAFNLFNQLKAAGIASHAVWGWNSPFTFDGSMNGLTQCMMGRPLMILKDLKEKIGRDFWSFLSSKNIGILDVSPSQLQVVLPFISDSDDLNVPSLIIGGEALIPSLWKDVSEYCYKNEVTALNVYGPTECSVVTHMAIVPETEIPTIGSVVDNMQAYVVNKSNCLVPQGAKGELLIGGIGLAKCYVNNEKLTDEKFISVPHLSEELLYCTGDIVSWLPSGQLYYYGRKDDQLQIRGVRVEIGDIVNGFKQLVEVADVCVIPLKNEYNTISIAAFIVLDNNLKSVNEIEIHLKLKEILPSYMLPSYLKIIDTIPLTKNGKVDRSKLEVKVSNDEPEFYTQTQQLLISIWNEILENKTIKSNDNFFVVGGNSLAAARITSMIRNRFEIDFEIKELFLFPTINELSEHIENKPKILKDESSSIILPINRDHKTQLSFAQERVWFIDRLEGSIHYHIPSVFRIQGDLDVEKIETSLNTIIDRHEILRTIYFEEDGVPFQRALENNGWKMIYEELELEFEQLQNSSYLTDELSKPFCLKDDYPIRTRLTKIGANDYILTLVIHHIACDGWSMGIFIDELSSIYGALIKNKEPKLQENSIQFVDYAIWERNHLSGAVMEDKIKYWISKLETVEPLNLPLDFNRPKVQSTRGKSLMIQIDKSLTTQLEKLAQEQQVTMFMLLLSNFMIVLNRYSGQDEIAVGTPVANRMQLESQSLIGYFNNTVVLVSDFYEDYTYLEFLSKVKENVLSAMQNQEIPFDHLVSKLEKNRDFSRTPIFQVMFVFEDEGALPELSLDNLEFSIVPFNYDTSKFDLTLNITITNDGLQLGVAYCTDLFLQETIEKVLMNYHSLLKSVINNIHLPLSLLEMTSEPDELLTSQEIAEKNKLQIDSNLEHDYIEL